MTTISHRYVLGRPCRACGVEPTVIFCEDVTRDGDVGQPYLRSITPCCRSMETFEFFGDTYRYNHRTQRPERNSSEPA